MEALNLEMGRFAVPAPNTVLHEMVTGEPIRMWVGARQITVPKPHLPVVEVDVNGYVVKRVLMGPPWSLLNQYVAVPDERKPEIVGQIETWLRSAAQRALQEATALAMQGVMSYAIGLPVVPRGEVWVGTSGLGIQLGEEGFAIRWPIASSNPLRVKIKARPGYGVWMNDEDLVIDRQGDSDGDLIFVVSQSSVPAPAVDAKLTLEDLIDLSNVPEIPQEVQQMDPQHLANGYAAKSLVGIATWWTWVEARWGYDRRGIAAWQEAYDKYTPAIEAMMDGRKSGAQVKLSDFGIGEGLPDLVKLINMALPGVRHMVASRNRPPSFDKDWRVLVRQYWSMRWAPEGVDLG